MVAAWVEIRIRSLEYLEHTLSPRTDFGVRADLYGERRSVSRSGSMPPSTDDSLRTACHRNPSLRSRIQALENADSKTLASAGVDVRKRGEQYRRARFSSRDKYHHGRRKRRRIVTAETVEHLSNNARASKHPDTIRKQGIDLSDQSLTRRVEFQNICGDGRQTDGGKQLLR